MDDLTTGSTTGSQIVTATVRRHPIRGALWGLLLGLGAALLLIGQKIIAFGTLPPLIVIVAGILVGLIWGLVAPAKGGVGPPVAPAVVGSSADPWPLDPNVR